MGKSGLSRRNFFGASAGAVVAAPSIATGLTADMAVGSGANLVEQYVPVEADVHGWLVRQLKDMHQRREECLRQNKLSNHHLITVERFRLEGMRSLSPSARARLAFEHEHRLSHAQELSYIDSKIAELKEQLGPLADLVTEAVK